MPYSVFDWVAAFGAAAVMLGLAVFVLWAAPRQPVNRALAAYATFWAMNFVGGTLSVGSGFTDEAAERIGGATAYALPFLYLLFAGLALRSPLARPLRLWWMQRVLVGVVLGLIIAHNVVPRPGLVLRAPVLFLTVWLVLFTYGLVAAFDAWRRAPQGTPTRARARSYLLAFGILDAGWILVQGSRLVLIVIGYPLGDAPALLEFVYGPIFVSALVPLHALLLFHGMFRFQLFDFDLKTKWVLKRSTVAAVLAGVFFVAKEGLEALLPVEGVIAGIAGATAVALLGLPVWRLANGLAHRLMPHVDDTPQYRERRGRELYQAALESALLDGVITKREEAMLSTLRERLGLDAAEAGTIEREVLEASQSEGGLLRTGRETLREEE